MEAKIEELWSPEHQAQSRALAQAVEDGDLLSALLAIEGRVSGDAMEVALQIATLGAEVRMALDRSGDPVGSLREVLVGQYGFVGAPEERYFDPESSYLSEVLRQRMGQPILLSSLWILVGQGAQIDVYGLNFPRHFLVGVQDKVVDPFFGGKVLSPADLRGLIEPLRPEYLQEAALRAMAARVLTNLRRAHLKRGARLQAYQVLRMHSELQRMEPELAMKVALETEVFGDLREARRLYMQLARHFPETEYAHVSEARLAELRDQNLVLN